MIDCVRSNPLRAVDWKWQRAVGCLEASQPEPYAKMDSAAGARWIRRAIRFQRQMAARRSEYQGLCVASEGLQDIYWAHNIHTQHRAGMRRVLEAYLLTGATDKEIAAATGIEHETVHAYESLFFNVREKLRYREYILHRVLGVELARGLNSSNLDTMWKLYGYLYGVHFLQALTAGCTVDAMKCDSPQAVLAAATDDAVSTFKLKAAIAAKTVGVNHATQMALLQEFTKFVEIEQAQSEATGGNQQILLSISAMMQNIPLTVGGTVPETGLRAASTNKTTLYAQTADELSYGEALTLSVTGQLPQSSDIVRR